MNRDCQKCNRRGSEGGIGDASGEARGSRLETWEVKRKRENKWNKERTKNRYRTKNLGKACRKIYSAGGEDEVGNAGARCRRSLSW